MTVLVGQYGDNAQLDSTGALLRSTAITVKTAAGATATLYADLTGAATVANPVSTDAKGNLKFFAPPAQYQLWAGSPLAQYATVNVDVPIGFLGAASGVATLDGSGVLAASQRWAVVAGLNVINPLSAPYSAAGNGTTDDTTPLQNALTALHTSGGALYLPSRSAFKLTGTLPITKPDLVSIKGAGAGQATLLPFNNGDCIRISMASFVADSHSGKYEGFTIDGTNAGASACGIHFGDAMNGAFDDLHVVNFTGASASGLHPDNVAQYTEGWNWGRLLVSNCTIGVLFDVNGGSSPAGINKSFGYHRLKHLRLTCNSGQVGIVARNGATLYNGEMTVAANLASGSTLMQVQGIPGGGGITAVATFKFCVQAECAAGSANGIQLSQFGGISGEGVIDLSSGTITSTNGSPNPGVANLAGWIRTPGLLGVSQLTGTVHATAPSAGTITMPAAAATVDHYVNGVRFVLPLYNP